MVVRLKDIRDGNEDGSTNGIVRLSDLRGTSSQENPKMTRQQFSSLTGIKTAIPTVNDIPAFKQMQENPLPTTSYDPQPELPGRDLPVVGPILRGLDAVSENPVVKKVGDIGRMFYTPGAGGANIAGITGAAERTLGLGASRAVESAAGQKVLGGINKVLNPQGINISTPLASQIARTAATEASVGAPLGAGQYLANEGSSGKASIVEAGKQAALGSLLGGATGVIGPVIGEGLSRFSGTKVGDSLTDMMNRKQSVSPEVEQATTEALNQAPATKTVTINGNLRPASQESYINNVMTQIKPIVTERMTPPLENQKELAKWLQPHLGEASLNEIQKMNYNDLVDLAGEVKKHLSTYDVARQVAKERGYNLEDILNGKLPSITERVKQDSSKRAYGIYDAPKVEISRPVSDPNFTPTLRASDTPKTSPIRASELNIKPAGEPVSELPVQTVKTRIEPTTTPKKVTDTPEFVNTVMNSPNTAQELVSELQTSNIKGSRTSDVLNRQEAGKLIEKHGIEGLYSKLMAKHLKFSPSESTAAQMIAKHFSTLGGKENMEKAINLVSRTAREGREMGQAIQALSQWNKLDETGALLLGERQLNRGVRDTTQWQSLTAEQAAPIQASAKRIGAAQETRTLADEVMSIVTNKKPGEALTDAEKQVIKQFQEKIKPFVEKKQNAVRETIEKVSKIAPKERTRDQVVNFLEAKAELARKRLEKSRNIGFAATRQSNPVADYAIIMAAEFAKGVRNFADYSELMLKNFGDTAKPFVREAYLKSVNIFRKENGLPTVEELEKVINRALSHDNTAYKNATESILKEAATKLGKERGLTDEQIKRNMNALINNLPQSVREQAEAVGNNAIERFTKSDMDALRVMATQIGFMSDEFKLEATQDLQKVLKGLGESTLGQKISTLQTGAQLLNAVTIGRNVIGNAAQITAEKLSKMSSVPIDWAFSKLTGERTIMFMPKNQESMWRNFFIGTKSGYEGVSPTGTLNSYDIHPEVFGNKNPLKYISKSLGASMQGFDFAAYRNAYGDVLATYAEQLGKAQGLSKAEIKVSMPDLIKQLDDRIYDMADQAGLYATFQDETLLSRGADMLKRGLNMITDKPMQSLVDRGLMPKSLSMEGFGLGDVVVKYARTPANLVMRGIDYSPIGFVRGLVELLPLAFNRGKFNQFAATRSLGRAITGTFGLTGLGYYLANNGILTGSASMDKDMRSIQEQSGQGAYKVNLSALSRFIMSGFDKNAAKFKEGDRMMDYAWLQPAAISLAMGVNANKSVKESGNADFKDWKLYGNAVLGGVKSVLENPMVQGLSNTIDALSDVAKKGNTTKLQGLIKSVPSSFVPTLVGQARTATDNMQRETYDENLFKEMMNIVKNKVPGLSKSLPVSYDSLGNARERIQGGQENSIGQYLTAFLSPAKNTEYTVSKEAKTVLDLLEQSGDQNVLPRVVDRYIMVEDPVTKKDRKLDLTAEQYSKLQKKVGEEVTRQLASSSLYLNSPTHKMEDKVTKVKDILSKVGQKARNEIRSELGYKKKQVR